MWLYLIYSNYAYLWSTDSRYSLLTATIALKFFWCWVVIAKSSDTKENWFIFKTPSVSSIMYLLQTIYALLPRFFFNLFGNQTAPYKCHTETDRAFLTENFFFVLMSQWSWAKKTGREQYDLGFVYLGGSVDNLLNWCFMQWAFAGRVKTACWQLISYLRNMCVMAVVSEVSFESNL